MKAVRVVVEGLGERKSPVASWRTMGRSSGGIVKGCVDGWGGGVRVKVVLGLVGGMTSMRCLMCWERGVRGCGCAIFVAQRYNGTRSSTIDMCVSK